MVLGKNKSDKAIQVSEKIYFPLTKKKKRDYDKTVSLTGSSYIKK